jgi:hypothetical protein
LRRESEEADADSEEADSEADDDEEEDVVGELEFVGDAGSRTWASPVSSKQILQVQSFSSSSSTSSCTSSSFSLRPVLPLLVELLLDFFDLELLFKLLVLL